MTKDLNKTSFDKELTLTMNQMRDLWGSRNQPIALNKVTERDSVERNKSNYKPTEGRDDIWICWPVVLQPRTPYLMGKPAALMCMVSTIPQASSCMMTCRQTREGVNHGGRRCILFHVFWWQGGCLPSNRKVLGSNSRCVQSTFRHQWARCPTRTCSPLKWIPANKRNSLEFIL